MKKLIAFIIVAFTSLNCFSLDHIGTEIVLYKNGQPLETIHITGTRSVTNYPCVTNENGVLIITSDRLIENAHIIITDSNGMIIANEVLSLTNTGIRIQIPDADEGEMYKIEIAYGDTYLYGHIIY